MTRSKYFPGGGRRYSDTRRCTCLAAPTPPGCGRLFGAPRWRRIILLVFCALLIPAAPTALRGQQALKDPPSGVGNLESAEVNGDTLTLRVGEDTIVVQVVAPNMLRVHYQPERPDEPANSRPRPKSHLAQRHSRKDRYRFGPDDDFDGKDSCEDFQDTRTVCDLRRLQSPATARTGRGRRLWRWFAFYVQHLRSVFRHRWHQSPWKEYR